MSGKKHKDSTKVLMSDAHRGEKNGRAEKWKLTHSNGTDEIIVTALKTYVEERGYKWGYIYNLFYTQKYIGYGPLEGYQINKTDGRTTTWAVRPT